MHEEKEITRLPFYKWMAIGLFDILKKIFLIVVDFIWSIIKAFGTIGVAIYKTVVFLGKSIYKGGKFYVTTFIKGTWKTRLSYLVMGSGAFFNRQIVKGLLYFFIQIGFFITVILFGLPFISKFGTLGTVMSEPTHWDPILNEYVDAVMGDNSMLILLFSVAVIILAMGFVMFYWMNIKLAKLNQELVAAGKPTKTFKQDVGELMNSRFHITILSLPTVTASLFTILPLIFMILIAFTSFDRFHQPPGSLFTWVGWDNFVTFLGGSSDYYSRLPDTLWQIIQWSIVWSLFATFSNYIFGMILALMINKKSIKFKKMWRTFFIITIAVPQFISLLIMARFLNTLGPVVQTMASWGWVPENFNFFATAESARATVIVVNMWVGVPYTMLITSGILMNIPADLYESATIDGAGPLAKFFKITLPYMLFVTGPYLVTAFIGNLNNFNVIFFLTGGGPSSLSLFQAGQTDLLVTWLYKLTVNESDYKIAATLGILIFIITSFFSLVMFSKTSGVKKEEEFQ